MAVAVGPVITNLLVSFMGAGGLAISSGRLTAGAIAGAVVASVVAGAPSERHPDSAGHRPFRARVVVVRVVGVAGDGGKAGRRRVTRRSTTLAAARLHASRSGALGSALHQPIQNRTVFVARIGV